MRGIKKIHIGKAIHNEIKRQGYSVAWFAEQLCYERYNVYKIFKKKNINIETLICISEILDHNFLEDYLET